MGANHGTQHFRQHQRRAQRQARRTDDRTAISDAMRARTADIARCEEDVALFYDGYSEEGNVSGFLDATLDVVNYSECLCHYKEQFHAAIKGVLSNYRTGLTTEGHKEIPLEAIAAKISADPTIGTQCCEQIYTAFQEIFRRIDA